MFLSNIRIVLCLFLFFLLPNSSLAFFSFSLTQKYSCPDPLMDCYFNITNNNPYSPIIPSYYPVNTQNFHYINFIFYIPSRQIQKWFFFEAYDLLTKESIITGGDCFFINATENFIYQIRFTKPLKTSSIYNFIQFNFFGLEPNFFMLVQAEFRSDIYFAFRAVFIDDSSSLYKYQIEDLKKYLDELDILKSKQKERKDEAFEHANKIVNTLFHKSLDTTIQYTENLFVCPIDAGLISVTVIIQTQLNLSPESFLKPEENKISETHVFKSSVNVDINTLTLFDDKISVDNFILKFVSLYQKGLAAIAISFNFEKDNYVITVSFGADKSIDLLFQFKDPETGNILYEIELNIKFKHSVLVKALVEITDSIIETVENIKTFYKDHLIQIQITIFIIVALTTIGLLITSPPAAGKAVAVASPVITEFVRNSLLPLFENS